MIVLAVKSYNGTATEPLEATFDELGGTIGRADSNLLVLPDPDRTISRVHATVARRDGAFMIEDRGSNPITVNGRIVGHGRQVPLAPGDVLQIGGYELDVRAGAQAPLPSKIPDDWDPFSTGAAAVAAPPPDPVPPVAPTTVMPRASARVGPATSATPSIDDLFGLDDKLPDADAGTDTDPLPQAPGDVGPSLDADIELLLPDLGAAPPAAPMPPAPQPAPITASPTPDARRTPVVSWDGSPRQATVVAPAGAPRRGVPAAPLAPPAPGQRPGMRAAAPGAAAMATAPSAAAAGAAPDELLRAFLEGVGGERAPPLTALTPDLMRLIGGLLAESVGGAIDLLHARAVVKNEMRADVTAIRPRQNNPLKFSPTAAVALQHLLTPTVPGFLPAEAAMRDAFQDLRAHELAVMAGMRSALTGLLQRFDPKTLETHLSGKSGLSALLAGGRRAQLWEAYQSLFGQLSAEAEDDFHALFGRAFLQAYEGHLAQLKAAGRPGGT